MFLSLRRANTSQSVTTVEPSRKLPFWPERDVTGHDLVSYPKWRRLSANLRIAYLEFRETDRQWLFFIFFLLNISSDCSRSSYFLYSLWKHFEQILTINFDIHIDRLFGFCGLTFWSLKPRCIRHRANSRFAISQWQTSLQSNRRRYKVTPSLIGWA